MQNYPFQLMDHGDKIIEMIVSESITPGHRTLSAISILQGKFDFVVLTLRPPLTISASLEKFTQKADLGELLLVIPKTSRFVQI